MTQPNQDAGEELLSGLTIAELQLANRERNVEWWNGTKASLSFRGNELAGEVGEACNVIKKLERERLGMRGSRATAADLATELADVVICASLIAMDEGINLQSAVIEKFNATSAKYGLSVVVAAAAPGEGKGR